MNKTALALSSLVMTFVGLLFLSEVRGTLNGAKEYQNLADFWKSKVAREQLKKLIVQGQFADFKQDVALLIPNQLQKTKVKEEKQKLRDLASVIPHETDADISLKLSADKLLKRGKDRVKKREYKDGIKILTSLINLYPDSHHLVEAHYLIIEAYSQQEQTAMVITWVDKMVELYPENRLTGYALLKVGGIYEMDGRPEDAVRIYKTIVAVYDDKKLISQAQVAVSELEL